LIERKTFERFTSMRAAAATGGRRGRIDDVAFNSFLLQHAVNPEAVQTG
jgi:hypothetical protein